MVSQGPLLRVAATATAGFRGMSPLVWRLAAILLLYSSGRMVVMFLAIYLLTVLGLSEGQIGIAVAAYGSGVVTGSLLGGSLAQRLSPVTQMAACLVGMALGFVWLSSIEDPAIFVLGLFTCANLEGALRTPAVLLLMWGCASGDRARAQAVYFTATGLGYAIGAALGGVLSQLDFSLLFWVNGSASLLAAGVVLWALPAARGMVSVSAPADATPGNSQLGRLPRNWPFVAVCIAALLHYCVGNQRLATYPLYLMSHYAFDAVQLGAILALNGLLVAASGVLIIDWLKRISAHKIASAGSLLLCSSFALLPVSHHIAVAFVLCVVMSLGDVLFSPSANALAYQRASPANRGSLLGIFFATVSTARIVGPLAGIWAFAALGQTATWLLCGVLGGLSAAVLATSARRGYG